MNKRFWPETWESKEASTISWMIVFSPYFLSLFIILASILNNLALSIQQQEIHLYLEHYLSPSTPFLFKLFNVSGTDAGQIDGAFRARELSHFFNWVDSQFISFCVFLKIPHLQSIVFYTAILMMMVVYYKIFKSLLTPDDFFVISFIVPLMLSTSSYFFSGYYFRTGKILVVLWSLILFWFSLKIWHRTLRADESSPKSLLILLSIFLSSLGLLDEIGVVFLVLFSLWYLLNAIGRRQSIYVYAAWVSVGSVIFIILYRKLIGPFCVKTWGVLGTGICQTTQPSALYGHGSLFDSHLSVDLFFSYFGSLFGHLPIVFLVIIFLSIFYFFTLINKEDKALGFLYKEFAQFLRLPVVVFMWVLLAILLTLQLMINFQPSIADPIIRRLYYPLPFVMICTFAVSIAIYQILSKQKIKRWFVVSSLLLMICLNLIDLIDTRKSVIANFKTRCSQLRNNLLQIEHKNSELSHYEKVIYLVEPWKEVPPQ